MADTSFKKITTPNNSENQNFEKKKEVSGGVTILHMWIKNHDNMMHGSWDIRQDQSSFLSSMTIFCPLILLTTQKNQNFEKNEKAWRYHLTLVYITNDVWCMVPEICSVTDRIFLFWISFCPFMPPNYQKNQNFEMKKTPGDIILHKCTKNHDCMLYCSWDMTCDGCNFYFSF